MRFSARIIPGTGEPVVCAGGRRLAFNAAVSWPLYWAFPAVVLSALAASVIATLLSPPVPDAVLVKFWKRTNPWGLWGRVARRAVAQGKITEETRLKGVVENLNDAIALCFAVPFQLCMLLGSMSFVFHEWKKFSFFAIGSLFTGVGLYFFWYRNLKSEEDCLREDEEARAEDAAEAAAGDVADGPEATPRRKRKKRPSRDDDGLAPTRT